MNMEKRRNIWSVAERGTKGNEKQLFFLKYLSSMNSCSSVLVAGYYVLKKKSFTLPHGKW